MTTSVQVVQKSVLRRTLTDLEPKLVAGLIAALSSSQIITFVVVALHGSRFLLLSEGSTLVPAIAFLGVGYLKASTHKGALLAKVEADLPGDLDTLAHAAADAGLVPQKVATGADVVHGIVTQIGTFPIPNVNHGSDIRDVPPEVAAALEAPPAPSTIEPTPMLPSQP